MEKVVEKRLGGFSSSSLLSIFPKLACVFTEGRELLGQERGFNTAASE